MVVFPNAKINLGLNVINKRPDGYHDIETIMLPIQWHDILEIISRPQNSNVNLYTSGNIIACAPEKNLVMKAVYETEQYTGKRINADLYLHKIIPDGAGLGGGSADAAFTINALNAEFRLGLHAADMEKIATAIGADCPFFIGNTPAFCTGIGNIMQPIAIQCNSMKIVVVKPPQGISTAEAYAGIKPKVPEVSLTTAVTQPISHWKNIIYNDFEPTVFKKCPSLKLIKEEFYQAGAIYASMSGSGSAIYGIFESHDNLTAVVQHFSNKNYGVFEGTLNF